MKKHIIAFSLLSGAFLMSANTFAHKHNAHAMDDVTMEMKKGHHGHKLGSPVHKTIMEYMLANGDISQDEIDQKKAQRKLERDELNTLKESGDKEGYRAKKREFKERYKAKKSELSAYVDQHDDLKAQLKEMRKKMKKKHKKPCDKD